MADDSTEQRLIALETKVSYQDKTIAELNDVIVDQNRTIAELERRLARVEAQLETEGEGELPQERPPHY